MAAKEPEVKEKTTRLQIPYPDLFPIWQSDGADRSETRSAGSLNTRRRRSGADGRRLHRFTPFSSSHHLSEQKGLKYSISSTDHVIGFVYHSGRGWKYLCWSPGSYNILFTSLLIVFLCFFYFNSFQWRVTKQFG